MSMNTDCAYIQAHYKITTHPLPYHWIVKLMPDELLIRGKVESDGDECWRVKRYLHLSRVETMRASR